MTIAAMTPQFSLKDSTYDLVVVKLVPDNSWLAAGEVIDITGRGDIHSAMIEQVGGYVWRFDSSTQKVLVYRQKDPAAAGGADIALPPVADSVDLSSLTPLMWCLVDN